MATYNVNRITYGSDTFILDSSAAQTYVVETTVTNVSGSYTGTVQDAVITSNMKPVCIELSNPVIFKDNINVTCSSGSVTIACSNVSGTSTVKITMLTGDTLESAEGVGF